MEPSTSTLSNALITQPSPIRSPSSLRRSKYLQLATAQMTPPFVPPPAERKEQDIAQPSPKGVPRAPRRGEVNVTFSRRLQSKYAEIERARFRRKVLIVGAATIALLFTFLIAVLHRSHPPRHAPRVIDINLPPPEEPAELPYYFDGTDRVAIPVGASGPPKSILLHHDHLSDIEVIRHNDQLLQGSSLKARSSLADTSPLLAQIIGDVETSLYAEETTEDLVHEINRRISEFIERENGVSAQDRLNAANIVVIAQIVIDRTRAIIRDENERFEQQLKDRTDLTPGLEKQARRHHRLSIQTAIYAEHEAILKQCIAFDHLIHYLEDVPQRLQLANMVSQMYTRIYPRHGTLTPLKTRRLLMHWLNRIIEQGDDFKFSRDISDWYPEFIHSFDNPVLSPEIPIEN